MGFFFFFFIKSPNCDFFFIKSPRPTDSEVARQRGDDEVMRCEVAAAAKW